jgi:hypothetical protein
MVERKRLRLRPPTSGSFKPGNQAGKGNAGNSANVRLTNKIISRTIYHKLHAIHDLKTRRTKAEALVDAVLERGIEEGDIQVLRALIERMEGAPLQKVAFKDFSDKPEQKTIDHNMTPREAERIYREMMQAPDDDDDDDDAIGIGDDDEPDDTAALPPPTPDKFGGYPRSKPEPTKPDNEDDKEMAAIDARARQRQARRSGMKISNAVLRRAGGTGYDDDDK